MGKSRWTLFIFKSHTAFLKIIRIPSCWSFFVGLHQRQMVKQPTVPLLCCYISSLLLAQWESEILKGRKTAIELRWYRQRRCRLPMMYEVRRSVHQRAGRLLLHPETPLSPSVTSPSEDPSPTLLPHFYTSQPLFSLFFFLLCSLSGCLSTPHFYSPSPLIRSLRVYWPTSHTSRYLPSLSYRIPGYWVMCASENISRTI